VIYLLVAVHVVVCLFLILVVLLQQGKGADLSVFGGGSTMAAFGARSATTLLHRLTVAAFVIFVVTTIGIAYMKGHFEGGSVMEGARKATSTPAAPAKPGGGVPAAAPATAPAPATQGATPPPTAPAEKPPASPPPAAPPSHR